MRTKIRPKCWLALALLVLPASSVIAQEPQSGQPAPALEAKLPALLSAEPVKLDPKDDELRKLLKARYNEAVAEMKARFQEFEAGRARMDAMLGASQRLVESGLELSGGPEDRVKLLEGFLEVAREVEAIKKANVDAGTAGIQELHEARYLRLDTEIRLLRAKREAKKGKDK